MNMNIETYASTAILGILGIVFHILVVKLPATKKRAQVANMNFSVTDYFKDDWMAISASFVTVVVYLLLMHLLVAWQPTYQPFVSAIGFCIGFMGSSVLVAALGKASDKINQIVNVKTDIADGVRPMDSVTK
jgi:hypothetical protein